MTLIAHTSHHEAPVVAIMEAIKKETHHGKSKHIP